MADLMEAELKYLLKAGKLDNKMVLNMENLQDWLLETESVVLWAVLLAEESVYMMEKWTASSMEQV